MGSHSHSAMDDTKGTKVLFVETHAIPVIDINVNFDAGSRRDPAAKSGWPA